MSAFKQTFRKIRIGLGKRLFDRSKRRDIVFDMTEAKSILFRRYDDKIGDMTAATPLFREIKLNNPRVKIMVLCGKNSADIIKYNPYVDEIFISKKRFWDFFVYLKIRGKADIGYDFDGFAPKFMHMFFWRVVKPKFIIGCQKKDFNIYDLSLDFTDAEFNNRHILYRHIKFLNLLGISTSVLKYDVFIPDDCIEVKKAKYKIASMETLKMRDCGGYEKSGKDDLAKMDSGGFSIAGGVCNSESEIILNKERGKTSICSSEERETLKMQGALSSLLALLRHKQLLSSLLAQPTPRSKVGNAPPNNSQELKVKSEKLKIEEKGDIVGVKAQTPGVIAAEAAIHFRRLSLILNSVSRFLSLYNPKSKKGEILKTKRFCGYRRNAPDGGAVGDSDKNLRPARPLDSKSLLPSTQQSDSADKEVRLNKKEQNRQRLAARFCDSLFSKISAANAAPEIFECWGGWDGTDEKQIKQSAYIVFNPFADSQHKWICLEKVKELIFEIQKITDFPIYVLSHLKNYDFGKYSFSGNVSLIKVNSILESASIIKESFLVISPDTSIVHIASAFSKPTIALYCNDIVLWGPNNPNAVVLYANPINSISADSVCGALKTIFANHSADIVKQ
ncbi:MAG: hypothetical protein LBH29_00080 [Elusimicrobiota bacterium]|nr:hypothetical protein [Elusimicrobiota bacterium]